MHAICIWERRVFPLPCKLEVFHILHHPCTPKPASTSNLNLPFLEKILQCFSLFVAKIIRKRNCIKLLVLYQTNGDLTSFFFVCAVLFLRNEFILHLWKHVHEDEFLVPPENTVLIQRLSTVWLFQMEFHHIEHQTHSHRICLNERLTPLANVFLCINFPRRPELKMLILILIIGDGGQRVEILPLPILVWWIYLGFFHFRPNGFWVNTTSNFLFVKIKVEEATGMRA